MKPRATGRNASSEGLASARIGQRIGELGGWRAAVLARVRALILEADPGMVEELKWKKPSNPGGIPVWSHDGIVCTGESYQNHEKLTFPRGSSLKDPEHLFNAGLGGKTWRAIDIHEGDPLNEPAFRALIREAVAANVSRTRAKPPAR